MAGIGDLIKAVKNENAKYEKHKKEFEETEKDKNAANAIQTGFDNIEKELDEESKNKAKILSEEQVTKKAKLLGLLDKVKENGGKIKESVVIFSLCSVLLTGALKDEEPLIKHIEPTYTSVGVSPESSDDMEEYALDSVEMDGAVEVESASEHESVTVQKKNDIEKATDEDLDAMIDQTSVDDNEKEEEFEL